jgi:lysozyme
LNAELLTHVKAAEGFRRKAYRCPAGVWTIGYGFTRGVKPGDVMTEPEASARLEKELEKTRVMVLAVSRHLEHDGGRRLEAITDFVYNCGIGAYISSTMKKFVDAGDWANAARQMNRWVRGGGKVLPGLVKRREVTSGWLLNG